MMKIFSQLAFLPLFAPTPKILQNFDVAAAALFLWAVGPEASVPVQSPKIVHWTMRTVTSARK